MGRAGKELTAPEHYIKTPASPMARMRPANGGDARGMARHREPVMNGGADLASLDGWFSPPVVTCDEQDKAVAGVFRPLQRQVDRPPRAVEAVAMEIHDAVGLQGP